MYYNYLYLQEWIRLNPSLSKLKIVNNTLIYEENALQYQQDISKFYMPLLLENEVFRNKLATYSANDLFNIIKVNCQAKDIIEKELKQMNEENNS